MKGDLNKYSDAYATLTWQSLNTRDHAGQVGPNGLYPHLAAVQSLLSILSEEALFTPSLSRCLPAQTMTLGKIIHAQRLPIPAWACFPITGSCQDAGAVYTLRPEEIQVRLALGL